MSTEVSERDLAAAAFSAEDAAVFARALKRETDDLREALAGGRFAGEPAGLRIDIDLWLLGPDGRPTPLSDEVQDALRDDRVDSGPIRSRLILRPAQRVPAGRPFSALCDEVAALLARVDDPARRHGARAVTVGLPPALTEADLVSALRSGDRSGRGLPERILQACNRRPAELDIDGPQPLRLVGCKVLLEAAPASLRVRLPADPTRAVALYNAALVLSAATCALAANAPALFGHRLWTDTRIPVTEQAVAPAPLRGGDPGPLPRASLGSGYARDALHSLYVENRQHFPVLAPLRLRDGAARYPHVRLHNRTVWRWTRPRIEIGRSGVPVLGIEHSVMSPGPTPTDLTADAALFAGAVHGLAAAREPLSARLPFARTAANLQAAARHGLTASVSWPGGERRLRDLILEDLLPTARAGLERLGVAADESRYWLGVVEARVRRGRTGSTWQQAWLDRHGPDWQGLTETYLQCAAGGAPVHEWPEP